MNLKKAKAIREQLKASGIDPREAKYMYDERSAMELNPYSLTIIMDSQCGRKVYKAIKRSQQCRN